MPGEEDQIRLYKDRFRIFLIIFFFSDPYSSPSQPSLKRVFKTEVKIQKIDFLLRNPDYLAHELLNLSKSDPAIRDEIKPIIESIYSNHEPVLRRLDMERFFFGAYEDIDDVISFLKSIDFIEYTSKKSADLKTIEKYYYVTETAIAKTGSALSKMPYAQWYVDRCNLIKKYFGDLSGTQLKVSQYAIEEYRNTSYGEFIGDISHNVKTEFYALYNTTL